MLYPQPTKFDFFISGLKLCLILEVFALIAFLAQLK